MRFFIPQLLLLLTGSYLGAGFLSGETLDLPEKAAKDRSEYRKVVLENGLKVVLLSDPDLNMSSAALSIDVGSLMDPVERQGLAHFLEHMLFLGTEKFPDEGEYQRFIRENGGSTNAYTSGDHTNYHFDVAHHSFEGALDRFSQFFISPLFAEEFTQREMNAVDSEFERNLENDFRRIYGLLRLFYNPEHPQAKFSTGNRDTLEGVDREAFIQFYKDYYSANQMGLALTGSASLDQLEQWARTYFSDIEPADREALSYPDDLILPEESVRLIKARPLKDLRELRLVFGISGTREQWPSKSTQVLGHILGFEGEGSLLSHYKKLGWATGLGAGFSDTTKDYTRVFVTIELTPTGQENYREVLEDFYAFLELLREEAYPYELFEELAVLARLDELYADKGEGRSRALSLANAALQYPLEYAERVPYLFRDPDPDSYFSILEEMVPERALTLLIARDVETETNERIYGTAYALERIEGELFERLKSPEPVESLHLPKPNPYVPARLKLLEARPVALIEEPGLRVFYQQDTTFERPRSAYVMRVRLPRSMSSLENEVYLDFYTSVLSEITNEEIYTASVGGASAGFSASLEGVRFSVSGYSGSAETLLNYVLSEIRNMDLPEVQFEAIKEKYVRELRNFELSQAYLQARDIQNQVGTNVYYSPEEKLPVAEGITLESVSAFSKRLYETGALEVVIYGNLDQEQAESAARQMEQAFGLRAMPEEEQFTFIYREPEGGNQVLKTQLAVNNSCYWQEVYLGEDTPENRAKALLINNFISEPFFSELRTRQQLGYIVSSFTTRRFEDLVAGFVIQSADYPAHELQARSEKFLAGLPEVFGSLPDPVFETLKAGVRAELEEADKSIAERASRFFTRAFRDGLDWDRRQATLKALKETTREDVTEALANALGEGHLRSYTVLAYAKQHEEAVGLEQSVK